MARARAPVLRKRMKNICAGTGTRLPRRRHLRPCEISAEGAKCITHHCGAASRRSPAALLAACAGNGDGLNANGQPITPGTNPTNTPLTADFQSIQDNVFTPICVRCHSGAAAPEGLQLDAAHSYALLVGVPSSEMPNLDRVKRRATRTAATWCRSSRVPPASPARACPLVAPICRSPPST